MNFKGTTGGFAMLHRSSTISIRILAIVAATVTLAGCGGSDKKAAPIARHIITSSVDCSENAGLTYEQCTEVIEKAVAEHEKSAATYTNLKNCETTEGAERCERLDEKVFRPKLKAFLLSLSDPPKAVPLYTIKDGKSGFRDTSNAMYLSEDEQLTFSKSAVHAAELFVGAKKKGGLM
jgi:uncharacterized protein YgiB involved in biofilm formation